MRYLPVCLLFLSQKIDSYVNKYTKYRLIMSLLERKFPASAFMFNDNIALGIKKIDFFMYLNKIEL